MTRFGDVHTQESEHGGWVVIVTLTAQDAMEFGDWTTNHIGQQLAIVVDGDVVSAPTIEGPILGGSVQISGPFTKDEAEDLADAITGS
ncbi:hypothetical protein ACFQV2_24255 [Actinokineospora soli]|uniref:SecDF P1 head subdomain domain-containing protein n=1 Tax=Actinokineospora soli TaxID=1048753 RepID=A0ABW2TS89_9PSEU